MKESPIYRMFKETNITSNEDTIITFSDSSWNDSVDTGRRAGVNISIMQGGPVNHSSHLPVLVAMSSGEAEYISAAVCMRASHLRMSIYDLRLSGNTQI